MENGRLALADWLAVATEFGDPVPVPYSSLSGRFVQRVPKSLHRQLVDEAKNEGVSLNTLRNRVSRIRKRLEDCLDKKK